MSTYNEMKKKAESDQDRIELRSEKVRNMIGEMPSFLIRWGIRFWWLYSCYWL